MKLKYVAIFLVLLCCLMGAASAAEDISADAVGDAIDDVVITDEAVDADLPTDDIISAEPADADSEADQSDVSIETNDEEGNIIQSVNNDYKASLTSNGDVLGVSVDDILTGDVIDVYFNASSGKNYFKSGITVDPDANALSWETAPSYARNNQQIALFSQVISRNSHNVDDIVNAHIADGVYTCSMSIGVNVNYIGYGDNVIFNIIIFGVESLLK